MKIILKSITFIGFQSKKIRASIAFPSSQTAIIYGHNGSGKTTFLKLIYATLAKNEILLSREKVQQVEISFINASDELCFVNIPLSQDPAGGQGISVNQHYDWSEFDQSDLAVTRSLSLGVDRGTSIQPAQVEPSDIFPFVSSSKLFSIPKVDLLEFSEGLAQFINRNSAVKARVKRERSDELKLSRDHAILQSVNMGHIETLLIDKYRLARAYASEQIQKALFDTLAVVIDSASNKQPEISFPADLGSQIAAEKERIIEALNEGADNNFKDRIVSILSDMNKDDTVYSFQDNRILTQLFWNVLKELKLEKQLLNSINTFIDTFNEFLGPHKSIDITKEGIILNVGEEPLRVEALSSGERHLFTFLALIVTDARERDFLIIDEPEISLNANWQRALVKLLQSLAPETQIILASHSPILAKGQPTTLVELKPLEIA